VKTLPYWWISLLVLASDQISKILVRSSIEYGSIIKLTPEFIWLTHVHNTGAAFSFSLGSDLVNRYFFIIVSIIAIVIIIFLNRKTTSKVENIAFSLILGGALGNFVDRIVFGHVTDFIWADFPDFIMERWPVFNLADSCIVIAIMILLVNTLFLNPKPGEVK
jgi:signal peptidase II